MKAIAKDATKTFLKLIDGLSEPGKARKVDNAKGAFMAVSVDFLERRELDGGQRIERYAVAHRYEQNGDLCPDPDVEFFVVRSGADIKVCPIAIDHGMPFGYRRYVSLNPATGLPMHWNKKGQADLASFCGTWMRNIKQQQEL